MIADRYGVQRGAGDVLHRPSRPARRRAHQGHGRAPEGRVPAAGSRRRSARDPARRRRARRGARARGARQPRASRRSTSLNALEGEIMCPTCHTTLDQSDSAAARRIEVFIQHRIDAVRDRVADQGRPRRELRRGDPRRAAPQGLRPARVVAAARRGRSLGALAVAFGVWRWSRARGPRRAAAGVRPRRRDRAAARRVARTIGLMGARLPIAFLAGFASVITPCVLPLVPGYLSALSSVEAGRLGERGTTRRVVARERAVHPRLHRRLRRPRRGRGGGRQRRVARMRRPRSPASSSSCSASPSSACCRCRSASVAPGLLTGARRRGSGALLGGAFAVCAAPCIGTVLAAVLVLASDTGTVLKGAALLAAYALGLGARVPRRGRRVRARDVAPSAGCATAIR